MRELDAREIVEAVAGLCLKANYVISPDIKQAFYKAKDFEEDELSKDIFDKLILNAEIAAKEAIPICQDTGMTVVFLEIGQNLHIVGGDIEEAVNKGVAKGYKDGFLRKSVVGDPINRINTSDNTPAVIHYKMVKGDKLRIVVAPKGFGSENMSALKMLKPSQGIDGVKDFVIETVKSAGPNPCPPIIVGVGVGGTMEKAAIMSKEALLRSLGSKNKNEYWSDMEEILLKMINDLKIGPGGFGGKTTAMAVHINTYATHIAGLPVAVNIGCHVTRHEEIVL